VGLRLLDTRRWALHQKHAREIEECANRYIPKGALFNEIPIRRSTNSSASKSRKRQRQMVVRYILNGARVHGPPYTDEENRDMFRRMQNGPRMMTSVVRGQRTVGPADTQATCQSAADAAVDLAFRRNPNE
jgi:hypothetical protein